MSTNASISATLYAEHRAEFLVLLGHFVRLFDDRPFRLPTTGRPSRPLYDAMMIALSLHPNIDLTAEGEGIKQRLAAALNNAPTYDVLVGRGNTMEAVRQRVDLASIILLKRPAP